MDDVITGTPNSLSTPGNSISPPPPLPSPPPPGKSISVPSLRPPASSPPHTGLPGEGWSTYNIITVILIVVVLALLGLNVFAYLAKGTDYIGWLVQKLTGEIPGTAKDIVQTTVKGTQFAANVAAGTVGDVGDVLSRQLDIKRKNLWEARDTGVRRSVADRDLVGVNKFPEHEPQYRESEDNNIQEKHKPGYCYIGTDRGYRTCIKVKRRDDCESGKIFPTMDICVNPSLRQ